MVEEKILLPHHEQSRLCTTRLPYRQGRKLTAVKVYTINDESKHLLVFGVPSLNLRQEARALFIKFGKILQFAITDRHPNEQFTETYHVIYERIQSARIAKRILDTRNFYGGLLHICYAPELETIADTREKLMQRRKDVTNRLNRNNISTSTEVKKKLLEEKIENTPKTILNMGEMNTIVVGKTVRDVYKSSLKRKSNQISQKVISKPFKPCYVSNDSKIEANEVVNTQTGESSSVTRVANSNSESRTLEHEIDLEKTLNYNNFGNEIIKKVDLKPANKIVFHICNKKL